MSDQLFGDLQTWAGLLVDQHHALGVSPLSSMPIVAPEMTGGGALGARYTTSDDTTHDL